MKVIITDDCTGCGVCETIAPDVFVVEDDKATVNQDEVADNEDEVREAASECPDEAIKIDD